MAAYANRRVLALTGVVLLSVVAMSMAAATLDSAQGTATASADPPDLIVNQTGTGPTTGGGSGNNSMLGEGQTGTSTTLQFAGCNELLAGTPGTLAFFGGLVGMLYLGYKRFSLGVALIGGYVVTPIALAFYFLRTKCVSAGGRGLGTGNETGAGGLLTQQPPGPDVPPVVMVGLFAVLFAGAAAAIFLSSGSGSYETEEDEEEGIAETDVEDIAAAAAEAADRLEERNADVDNEVYRAWWEMTQLLNVSSPETHTPGEFAQAAVEAGIDREYVEPLTTLFEEVRYGHQDPESREERALEVFRAIEDEYGSGRRSGGSDATPADARAADAGDDQEDDR